LWLELLAQFYQCGKYGQKNQKQIENRRMLPFGVPLKITDFGASREQSDKNK
jgi:hypothetical protein